MDKNRLLGFVIIGLIALFAILYVLWLIVFNKGHVVFEGVPPFNVSIDGNTNICLEKQCDYSLSAREHSYVLSKEGYFDQAGNVSISRGKTVLISYEAVFEAKAIAGIEYPTITLPVGYSKYLEKLSDVSLFHMLPDKYQLKKMPKKIDNIQFAPSGKSAVLFKDEKVLYYKTDTFESNEIDSLSGICSVAWNNAEDALYSVIPDEASKKDALVKINLNDDSIEKYVYFLRDINKYLLSVSPSERYVILIDTTSDMQILYLIDLEQKTRTNIFEGHALTQGHWSDNDKYYIFSGKKINDDVPKLWMLNSQNKNKTMLKFNVSPNLITDGRNGKFYFVSNQNYSLMGGKRPYLSNFDENNELNINRLTDAKEIALHLFNADEGQTYLVLELTNVIPLQPERIEIDTNGSIVRMLIDAKYYDVKVDD